MTKDTANHWYLVVIWMALICSVLSSGPRGPPIYTVQTNTQGRNTVKAYGLRIPTAKVSSELTSNSSCGCTWLCWADPQCAGISYTYVGSNYECRFTQEPLDTIYLEFADNSTTEADLDKTSSSLEKDGFFHVLSTNLKVRDDNKLVCNAMNPSSFIVRIQSQNTADVFVSKIPDGYYMHMNITHDGSGFQWGDNTEFGLRGEDSIFVNLNSFTAINGQIAAKRSGTSVRLANYFLTWAYCMIDPLRQGTYGDTTLDP